MVDLFSECGVWSSPPLKKSKATVPAPFRRGPGLRGLSFTHNLQYPVYPSLQWLAFYHYTTRRPAVNPGVDRRRHLGYNFL